MISDQSDLLKVEWSDKIDITFQGNQNFTERGVYGCICTDVRRAHHPYKRQDQFFFFLQAKCVILMSFPLKITVCLFFPSPFLRRFHLSCCYFHYSRKPLPSLKLHKWQLHIFILSTNPSFPLKFLFPLSEIWYLYSNLS